MSLGLACRVDGLKLIIKNPFQNKFSFPCISRAEGIHMELWKPRWVSLWIFESTIYRKYNKSALETVHNVILSEQCMDMQRLLHFAANARDIFVLLYLLSSKNYKSALL